MEQERDPGRESTSPGYWLSQCHGFRVDSKEGRIGIVEDVLFGADRRPAALSVRTGLLARKLVLIPVEDVERVIPRARRVLLRAE
jgi:hypothetical protein